jgi:hypothetical protein
MNSDDPYILDLKKRYDFIITQEPLPLQPLSRDNNTGLILFSTKGNENAVSTPFFAFTKNWLRNDKYPNDNYGLTLSKWMVNNGTIVIYSPSDQTIVIHFDAYQLNLPKRINIVINGDLVSEITVKKNESLNFKIPLKEGRNILVLNNIDSCEQPGNYPNPNPPCLSIHIRNFSISNTL